MFLIPGAAFVHMPKTGGLQVRAILKSQITNEFTHQLPQMLESELQGKAVFGFVRNPWSWYVSWYNFQLHGSDSIKESFPFEPTFVALGGKRVSFETMVRAYCEPTREFKRKAYSIALAKASRDVEGQIVEVDGSFRIPVNIDIPFLLTSAQWMKSERSFFSFLVEAYLGRCTRVGRTETLRADLTEMLRSVGQLTQEATASMALGKIVNKGREVDYTSYYTPELRELVRRTSSELIETYDYQFGDQ